MAADQICMEGSAADLPFQPPCRAKIAHVMVPAKVQERTAPFRHPEVPERSGVLEGWTARLHPGRASIEARPAMHSHRKPRTSGWRDQQEGRCRRCKSENRAALKAATGTG
jgi:hypothetical protein